MNLPRLSRVAIRVASVTLGILVGLAWYLFDPPDPVGPWWAFAVAAVLGEFVRLETISGKETPTSLAVLAAYALLGHGPIPAAVLAAGAWVVAAAIRLVRDEEIDGAGLPNRVAWGVALAGIVAATSQVAPGVAIGGDVRVPVATIVVITTVFALGSPIWAALTAGERAVRSSVFSDDLAETWPATVTLASAGVLTAVAYGVLHVGALVLLWLPVLAVRGGLHRYVAIRRTYDQTVVAMSEMIELTGHVRIGHGVRVREMSVEIGRLLDLSETELRLVERTAALHEIGRIATDDPDFAAKEDTVAAVSGQIVAQAGSMPEVSEAVRRQLDPYRRPGTGDDTTLPMAARIVRTVCIFDRLAGGTTGTPVWAALDRLHRSMAYEHDPRVVSALVRVVEARQLVAV